MFARVARGCKAGAKGCEAGAKGCDETVYGRSYKGAVADARRLPMYDGRRRRLTRLCTRYDGRCTTRTTAPLRAHAQRAVSAYGQRGCAAPQGRTGRVVPVSQLAEFARVARELGKWQPTFS